jgi:uncharacterized membrane protein YfcA
VRGVPFGFGLMFIAGVLSGLLGIGSGALKVLAMDQIMHIPFKVSTTIAIFNLVRYRYTNRPNPLTPFSKRE